MNWLAGFLQYAQKVFQLPRLLRRVREGRPDPQIALQAVNLRLMLGGSTQI